MSWYGRRRAYVPVSERRAKAARQVARLRKAGRTIKPVTITGRAITTTFWGKAWCKNLEAYSDYANRLPRGRAYARNGSIVDLQIEERRITALVSGSRLYTVTLMIDALPTERWHTIRDECSGHIDSLVELLQGDLSSGVMKVVTRHGAGLFPSPGEIALSCTCPDWAVMCKHVAATMYGVGARLDHEPQMLFSLRGVDPSEMIEGAIHLATPAPGAAGQDVIAQDDLASIFGLDIDFGEPEPPPPPEPPAAYTPSTEGLSAETLAVLEAITECPGIQLQQIVDWLEVPKSDTRKAIARLKKRGLVVFIGASRTGGYCISD